MVLCNKESTSLVEAWRSCHKRLTNNGHKVQLHILDNEISAEFMDALTKEQIEFQTVAPGMHRANAAERAIRVVKNHLLSGLALCHKDYPIREWDRLLTQGELTVNLLRNSRVNPSLSAWAYLFGNHDFNRVPLAPPGTKVIIHIKPDMLNHFVLVSVLSCCFCRLSTGLYGTVCN